MTTAVVTGAASGLGLAVTKLLIAEGAEVIGLDLEGQGRPATVESTGAGFVPCDVSDLDAWDLAVTDIGSRVGAVDLLALNAGVMTRRPTDPIDDDPWELARGSGYRKVFAVNVDGVVNGLVACRPLLTSGSSVAITASEAGLKGNPFDPYYSMSKHAVVGLVRSAAPLLEQMGVRINALCPGGIDTAIVPDQIRAAVSSDRFRPPPEIAAALLVMARTEVNGGIWLPGPGVGSITRYEVAPPEVN